MLDRSFVVHHVAAAATVALVVAVAVAVASRAERDVELPQVKIACGDVPSLGVCVAPAPDGARIVQITPGSTAARAGWRVDDRIEEVSCHEVRDAAQLQHALAHYAPRIKIVRDGETIAYRLLPR